MSTWVRAPLRAVGRVLFTDNMNGYRVSRVLERYFTQKDVPEEIWYRNAVFKELHQEVKPVSHYKRIQTAVKK